MFNQNLKVSIVKNKVVDMKMSDDSLRMQIETYSDESPATNKSPATNESKDKIVLLLDQVAEESKFEKTPARKAKPQRQQTGLTSVSYANLSD